MRKRAILTTILLTFILLSFGVSGTAPDLGIAATPSLARVQPSVTGQVINSPLEGARLAPAQPTTRYVPKERPTPRFHPRIQPDVQPAPTLVKPQLQAVAPVKPVRIPGANALKQDVQPLPTHPVIRVDLSRPQPSLPEQPAASQPPVAVQPSQPTPTTAQPARPAPTAPMVLLPQRQLPPPFKTLNDVCGYCGYDRHTCARYKAHMRAKGY